MFPPRMLTKSVHRLRACEHILASGRFHSFNENLLIPCFVSRTVLGYEGCKLDPVHALTGFKVYRETNTPGLGVSGMSVRCGEHR